MIQVLIVENLIFSGIGIDGEVSKTLQKILTKQGMKFKLGTKVTAVRKEGETVKIEVEAAKGGNKETVSPVLFIISYTYSVNSI